MTATDTIRAMLDERGVEYTERDVFGKHVFHWGAPLHGAMFTDAGEWAELVVENATPEQAIEATLGSGECRLIPTRDKPRSKAPTLTCSECGWWTDRINDEWRYCPCCGKKVMA